MNVDLRSNSTGEIDGINWQVSLAGGEKYLSYPATLQRPPVCNEGVYGSCVDKKTGKLRTCSLYTRCDHSSG
ncbi:hypothetical protein KY290_013996 [Solanum tuberosum]|uniref:Uncharacterized protein n=2 Tax=Solanum tuberosum TaxID=4113 RepID=A0ABQ7VP33_SOLTU|nr:hypothetical protein KY284_013399 [Solanum tuberosum]KAH0770015.1 hypothetical protein KY290_013996 [Solanum tuberosum]